MKPLPLLPRMTEDLYAVGPGRHIVNGITFFGEKMIINLGRETAGLYVYPSNPAYPTCQLS